MATQQGGNTVNWVDFATLDNPAAIGTLRQVARHLWKEDSVQDGRDRNTFKETLRDAWRIELSDHSRNLRLRIDLSSNMIRLKLGDSDWSNQYPIVSSSSKPTGWMANRIEHGPSPDRINGVFKQIGGLAWREEDAEGKAVVEFDEVQRDDWSVYLRDPVRDVSIQLDLHRRKVIYAERGKAGADLYNIANISTVLSGWLVNRVEFSTGGAAVGMYRQTPAGGWVEDSTTQGREIYKFDETGRDDWSVYLRDTRRKLSLQLDLFKHSVSLKLDGAEWRRQFDIVGADRLGAPEHPDARGLTHIYCGDAAGKHDSRFRQTGHRAWVEEAADGSRTVANFKEIGRDRWSILLSDATRNLVLRLDVYDAKVLLADGSLLRRILGSERRIDGNLVNAVDFGSAKKTTGQLVQTGPQSWAEFNPETGRLAFLFDELSRTEGEVYLHDIDRDVHMRIDMVARKVRYSVGDKASTVQFDVLAIHRTAEPWRRHHRINSRSVIAEEYAVVKGQPRAASVVYRTSVTLPPDATHLDLWSSKETTVVVDDVKHVIDPVRSVRLRPKGGSRLSVSLPGDALETATLYARTNLMNRKQKHVIMPDVEAHRKIAALPDGAMYQGRAALGLDPGLSEQDIGHLQTAITNVARTVQYTYNQTPHGVHHDRAVLPANMEHPHFMLDCSGGKMVYRPLNRKQVLGHIAGARRIDAPAAQGLFDSIGDFFSSATQIIVHTTESLVTDAIDTAKTVGKDVIDTVDQVGEDLIHGDLLNAGKDFIQGGEHAGGDLVKGVANAGGDLVKGAGQLLVVTLKLGSDVLQFVVEHTGFIGKALGWLLEKAGGEAGKAVRWLLEPLGWDDILHAHDLLVDFMNRKLGDMAQLPLQLKARSDAFFAQLAKTVTVDMDKAIQAIDPDGIGNQPATGPGHSEAIEKIEWLLGKVFSYTHGDSSLADAFSKTSLTSAGAATSGPMARFQSIIDEEFGADGSKLQTILGPAITRFETFFTSDDHDPRHLIGGLLEILKDVAVLGIDIVAKVIDVLLDLVAGTVQSLKSLANDPLDIPFLSDFYSGLTDGRPLTVMSLAALLIAVPGSIIHKAMFGVRMFNKTDVALELPEVDDFVRRMTAIYGVLHLVQSITTTSNDVYSGIGELKGKQDPGWVDRPHGQLPSVRQYNDIQPVLNSIFVAVGCAIGMPAPIGTKYEIPSQALKSHALRSGEYWNGILWVTGLGSSLVFLVLNFFQLGFTKYAPEKITGKVTIRGEEKEINIPNDVSAYLTGIWGLAHIGLIAALSEADRAKQHVVSAVFADPATAAMRNMEIARAMNQKAIELYGDVVGDDGLSIYKDPGLQFADEAAAKVWVDHLRAFNEWGAGYNFSDKIFGNVCTMMPEWSQFGVAETMVKATEGYSLFVSAAFDAFGHLGEGITVLARLKKRAIY